MIAKNMWKNVIRSSEFGFSFCFIANPDNMAKNLTWTSSLGEAYHNQQADVMAAIQTLHWQPKAKGNLNSSPQVSVAQQSPQVIVIQPTNPQIVYVPQYNPP